MKGSDMAVEVQWINHASFRIAGGDSVVYIDPWKLTDSPRDADVVIVSHSHHDHCSSEDIAKVSKPETTVIAPPDTVGKLRAAIAVAPGERIAIKEVTVAAVAAYNVGKAYHPADNKWIGAVVTLVGKRIYYAGDTDLIVEMDDLEEVDLALLPVGGTYTMTAAEAAQACERIGCKAAMGYHWGDIVGSIDDAEAFAKAVTCCKTHLLQPGEKLVM